MNKLLLSILLFAFANVNHAQIAEDFEFIDHKVRNAYHGVSKTMGHEFIYVSHNINSWPMTSVIKVNTLDHSIDTLITTFSSSSSIQEHEDGSFQIYLTSLFDYDVGIPGAYIIDSDGENVEVHAIFEFDSYGSNWDEYRYPYSLAKEEDGSYIFNEWEQTLRLNPDETIDTLFQGSSFLDLIQNKNKKIYGHFNNKLYEVTDTAAVLMIEFEDNIVGIENNGDFMDVLFEGRLERWVFDFSSMTQAWDLPTEIENFFQLTVDSFLVRVLIEEGNQFRIQEIDADGNTELKYEGNYDSQGIKGFHELDGPKYLLIGNDSLTELSYNTIFFRNIDTTQEIAYQSRDVSIDSFAIHQIGHDFQFEYIDFQTGDSVFIRYVNTAFNLTFTNRSDTIIYHTDCKGAPVAGYWYFFNSYDYSFNNILLMPGESYTISDTIRTRENGIGARPYGIPGANFRFNNHPDKLVYPDFTASFENVSFDPNLNLFPNPASEELNLRCNHEIESISIYNTMGQLMIFKSKGYDLNQIDISQLEQGNYFIRLQLKDVNTPATQQFVKISN